MESPLQADILALFCVFILRSALLLEESINFANDLCISI